MWLLVGPRNVYNYFTYSFITLKQEGGGGGGEFKPPPP